MSDAETPVAPYPPYPHLPFNRVKSILEYSGLITPQEPKVTPQNASPITLSEVVDKDPETPPSAVDPQVKHAAVEEIAAIPSGENLVGSPGGEDDKPLSGAEFGAEAHRIARELVKLYHVRAITGRNDPNARFYTCLIATFGAAFVPQAEQALDSNPDGNSPPGILMRGKPYTPTEQQRVRIPYGLTYAERWRFFQDDLDSLNN
jgi:hypothetical protein